MEDFFPQEKITDPTKIFGREEKLQELIDQAQTITQLQIIGARRFGKTTISLCLETALRNDSSSRVYPIYTDVKTAGIKGKAGFYKYLISVLVRRLTEDKIFRVRRRFNSILIRPSCDDVKVFKRLSSFPDDDMDKTFIHLVRFFAEKINKTILFIFDEFEYLAKNTFVDNLEGFCPLRDFSTERLDCGVRPFSFWLVGAHPWGDFIEANKLSKAATIGGSGEFNNVEMEVYLPPISKESFLDFWKSRCLEYYGDAPKGKMKEEYDFLSSMGERAYDSVSGVPYYANSIAKHLKTTHAFPDYTIIKSHLDEALSLFEQDSLLLMKHLCVPRHVVDNDAIKRLKKYGFVQQLEDGNSYLSMGYLRDYIKNKTTIQEVPVKDGKDSANAVARESLVGEEKDSTDEEMFIENLVNEINELIRQINNTYRAKRRKAIFETPEQALDDDKAMRSICRSRNEFKEFMSPVYLLYYERSKSKRPDTGSAMPGQLLYEAEKTAANDPNFAYSQSYYRNREFFKIIEPLRASYGPHIPEKIERKPGDYDQFEALERLKGNRNDPEPHEWPQLQIRVLELLKEDLLIVKKAVYSI